MKSTLKDVEVELKLKCNHPAKSMRLQNHVIGMKFKKYKLSVSEQKELSSKGCKHWFISKEEFEKAKEKVKKK